MSSSQVGLFNLKLAFVFTLETLSPHNPLKPDLKTLRAFSEALSRIADDKSFPQTSRIRRDWYRACSHLVSHNLAKNDKIKKRIERISSSLVRAPEKRREKTVAESIQDLLIDDNVQKALPKSLSSPPGVLAAATSFVSRIIQGQYGSKVKESILDVSTANPLQLHVNFPRLLLLDLLVQKKNLKEVEWFSQAKELDVQALQRDFNNFKLAMQAEMGVSEKEFPIAVLGRKACFNEALEKSIAKLLSLVRHDNKAHSQLLNVIGPYFMPTDNDLELIVNALSSTRPDRAFATACLASPKERIKLATLVLDQVVKTDVEQACRLAESLLDSGQLELYCQLIRRFAVRLAEHNRQELAGLYALGISEAPQYPGLCDDLAVEFAKRGSDAKIQEQMVTLIRNIRHFSQQEVVLETFLDTYVSVGDPTLTLQERFERCSRFLNNFSPALQASGSSSLIFFTLKTCLIMMTYDENEKKTLPFIIKSYETIKDPLTRQNVLERVCSILLINSDCRVAQGRIEALVEAIKNPSEKSYLWKQLALFLNQQNEEERAVQIAGKIPQENLRIQTLRLLAKPDKSDKPASSLLQSKAASPVTAEGGIRGVLRYLSRAFFGKS